MILGFSWEQSCSDQYKIEVSEVNKKIRRKSLEREGKGILVLLVFLVFLGGELGEGEEGGGEEMF